MQYTFLTEGEKHLIGWKSNTRLNRRSTSPPPSSAPAIHSLTHLPCSRSFKERGPFICIEELSFELRGKLCVAETGWVVFNHEVDVVWNLLALPIPPEPFAAEGGHRKYSKVDEDAEFSLVIPGWKRSGVQALPVRGVPDRPCWTTQHSTEKQEHRPLYNHFHTQVHAHRVAAVIEPPFGVSVHPLIGLLLISVSHSESDWFQLRSCSVIWLILHHGHTTSVCAFCSSLHGLVRAFSKL